MAKMDMNREPYHDDFTPEKNYLKILFRPGRPVQGRELNQTQSILQHQIQSFANHIFKNGSKVSNAHTALHAYAYVRLMDDPDLSQYQDDVVLVGEASGITAKFIQGVNATGDDPATLYVVYTSTAIDGETDTFIPGENIRIMDTNGVEVGLVTVRCPSCPGSALTDTLPPTGKGQFFNISEGIIYFEGMFIHVPSQDIIINKYIQYSGSQIIGFEPCKIGLDFIQEIITHEDDVTLLDPALGYPNSTAPGADRYKVTLNLVKRPYDEEDGECFIPLCRMGEGMTIEFMKADSEYADIMDMIAKRTYETNGDYTIRPFRVNFLNSKKKNATDPKGWRTTGKEDEIVAVVSSSVAYVKGYRVETIGDTPAAFKKARDTRKMPSFVKHFDPRTYILAQPKGNALWPHTNTDPGTLSRLRVSIYDQETDGSGTQGAQIGSFRVSDIQYVEGDVAAGTATYRYSIYDLSMLSGKKLEDARSYALVDNGFYANAVADRTSGKVEIYNTNHTALIYRIDRDHVKSLRSSTDPNNGSINIVTRRKLSGVADATGNVTFTTSSNEYFENAGAGLVVWSVNGGTTRKHHGPSVANLSPTTLTLNLGSGSAGDSVYVIVDTLRTSQKEMEKTPTNLTVMTNTMPSGTQGSEIPLGVADAFRIRSVKVFLDGSPDTEVADLTHEYTLEKGITDLAYTESKVVRTTASSFSFQGNHRLAINFDYFMHSGTQGYFTVDSYAAALNDPASGVTYETLGDYTSQSGEVFPLAASIDFRPIIMGSDPIVARLPTNSSTMVFDLEYYLGRVDLLQINKDGVVYVKKGEPSESPRPPKADADAMALYEIWLTPYTYSLADINTKYIDNRRYTMRDIGALDKRLTNVEYITALNVLEKSAADMSIKDANGLDRYKNGFIADNFQDFQAADLQNIEFKAGTDRTQRQLRPSFKANSHRLRFNPQKSSGFQLRGNVATRPFTEEVVIEQPYGTKHVSINPYMQYNQKGQMALSPNNDVWTDTTTAPEVVIDIDAGVDAFRQLADASGMLGTDWGSWVDQNRTILGTATTRDTILQNNQQVTTTTQQTTTQITSTRTGTSTTVESRADTYTIDDIVKDVQLIPYVRAANVEFYATKLKPNTRVYAFFDGQPVSAHCRDIGFQLSAANAATATQLVEFGSPLITDSNGEIRGEFRIPAGRFFVGEKRFVLSDDQNLSGDPDMETTRAETVYFAGGLDVTKQNVTMNVITPRFEVSQVSETTTRTETNARSDVEIVNIPEPAPAPPVNPCLQNWFNPGCFCAVTPDWTCYDPVAQGFLVDQEMFLSGLDIYFRQVDLMGDRIFVELRTMVNGYPSTTTLARQTYSPDQIQPYTSEDSSTPFRVEFDAPVFVEGNTRYCFVVGGASPNTRLWFARLGEEVVDMPGKIVERHATGEVSFRSLNGATWNAEQFEQIKYKLHRAKFSVGDMKLVFENDTNPDSLDLGENPFLMQAGQTRIRVFLKDHGLTEGDRVSISMSDSSPFLIRYTDFVPQIGQTIHTVTGKGIIEDIKASTGANEYLVTVKNMSGVMLAGQVYTCDQLVKSVRDSFILTSLDSRKGESITLNQCYGQVLESTYQGRFPSGNLAGIPIEEFNTEHVNGNLGHSVVAVDSLDSFIINVQTPATASGRFGGKGIKVYRCNEKYDVFNVSGAYLPYRSSESWSLKGVGHGLLGGLFETANYQRQDAIKFNPQEDKFLGQPYKIASTANEQIRLGNDRSVIIEGDFTTTSEFSSPVVNLDTFSMTTISNRVEWQDRNAMTATPQAPGQTTWTEDEHAFLGSETYKYVTRTVNLANPASDIHIYLDVYKDLNADFDVYIKRLPVWESQSIDNLPWMKVTGLQKNRSSFDLTDFIEYHIIASEHIVDYVSGHGQSYPGWLDSQGNGEPFTAFKVKLVGKSRNSAKPPLFRALRIIAVT